MRGSGRDEDCPEVMSPRREIQCLPAVGLLRPCENTGLGVSSHVERGKAESPFRNYLNRSFILRCEKLFPAVLHAL